MSKVNIYRVLRTIQISSPISRKEIALKLGLDKSTLSKIVSSLLEKGIVLESRSEILSLGVGRRPIILDLNPAFGVIVGIEIDSDHMKGCLINIRGELLTEYVTKCEPPGSSIVSMVSDFFQQLTAEYPSTSGIPILGLGIALPGIVDPVNGVVTYSHPLAIEAPFALAAKLQEEVRVPVLLENNANCGCWGELFLRKERQDEDLLFVFVDHREKAVPGLAPSGMAVGLGVSIDGQVRHGKNHLAGVFRSALLQANDQSQFHAGDREAVLKELGANIAVIVNTLAPEYVVMYSEELYEDSLAIIRNEIEGRWPFPVPVPGEVVLSSLPSSGLAFGAAAMFMETLFSMPRIPRVGENPDTVYRGKDLLSLF